MIGICALLPLAAGTTRLARHPFHRLQRLIQSVECGSRPASAAPSKNPGVEEAYVLRSDGDSTSKRFHCLALFSGISSPERVQYRFGKLRLSPFTAPAFSHRRRRAAP